MPQGLYAINNNLKFAMQLFFRPTTTKMLGNLKVWGGGREGGGEHGTMQLPPTHTTTIKMMCNLEVSPDQQLIAVGRGRSDTTRRPLFKS